MSVVAVIVRMGLVSRRPDLTQDAFLRHWREVHGPLVRSTVTNLRGYVQNAVEDRAKHVAWRGRGDLEVDGISQLSFERLATMREAVSESTRAILKADEANFIADLAILTTTRRTVIAPPTMGQLVKRMAFLYKSKDVSRATFDNEWSDLHASLVCRLPGVVGYRQNLVLDMDRSLSPSMSHRLPIDGVVEIWFKPEDTRATFQSPRGQTAKSHGAEFIGAETSYTVNVTVIVPETYAES